MNEQTQIEQQPAEETVTQDDQQEAQQEPVESQTEQGEQQGEKGDELAAIMAGYNKQPQFKQEEPEAPAQAMPKTETPDELAAKLKKVDELENAVNDRLRKLNNMVGNLKQRLDAIPKDAPKSEVRAITSESMKKMRELGFDEIADALAEDLNGAISVQSAPQVDVQEVIARTMKETAEKELDDLHPDWRDLAVVNDHGEYQHQGFSSWLKTLSSEMQEKVRTSNSVVFAARVFDTYKDWEKEKAGKETQARKASESRLQNAVTPTQGKAAPAPSRLPDDAGLWAGYNKGPKPLNRTR